MKKKSTKKIFCFYFISTFVLLFHPSKFYTMKKFLLFFALAATMSVFSCKGGEAEAPAEDTTATEAAPVEAAPADTTAAAADTTATEAPAQ